MKELRVAGEKLLAGEWITMGQEERCQRIRDFCVGYVLPPLSQYQRTTYRARINEDGQLFDHVDKLLAPPAHLVKRAGRLNRAGESTLYVSGQPVAAIFETKPEVGTTISVLACRARPGSKPFILAPVAMSGLKSTPRLGPLSRLHRDGPLGAFNFGEILERRGLLDQWKFQDETIGKLLTTDAAPPNDQDLYDLTIGVRDHLYATWPEFDGISYPSIATLLTTPNTAIEQKRWDDIEPLEVWVTEVTWDMVAGYQKEFGPMSTRPLLKHGVIQADGSVDYKGTRKTFMTALNEFKQRHGFVRGPEGLAPLLLKPWMRRRLSYGTAADRVVFDF